MKCWIIIDFEDHTVYRATVQVSLKNGFKTFEAFKIFKILKVRAL